MKIIEKTLSNNLTLDNNTFVFDIETTGLNSKYCKIILIGILYNCQNSTIIKQFFAENQDEEKELLLAFIDSIKDFNKHISYNGLTFDIPFINSRLKKHNIDFFIDKTNDFDILKFIKPFKNALNLPNCKLSTIENCFGINRNDLISGKESVDLYKTFEKEQDLELMETILLHNYEDIYNLSKLIDIEDKIQHKLDLLNIQTSNLSIKIFPLNYKINHKKLTVNYYIFYDNYKDISIYKDNYVIYSIDKNISLEINISKGTDINQNDILFYNLSKIIPLKFNDDILENNIYTLANFIISTELSNL